jgi:hypothetical protein
MRVNMRFDFVAFGFLVLVLYGFWEYIGIYVR